MRNPSLLIAWCGAAATAVSAELKDYPVQPVPFTAVRVEDSFWTPRMETNRVKTVWYDFQKCETRIDICQGRR
jgi:hypothetical protein